MRLQTFVILWLAAAVALFAFIPDSRVVARFVWDAVIAEPEYVETEGEVVLTSYALIVNPIAYLPYVWLTLGVIGLIVYLIRSRRSA